jgi:hypothetical protein
LFILDCFFIYVVINHDFVFISVGAIMSAYAQMMKNKGAMSKKPRKETPAQNLERELLMDHEASSTVGPHPTLADIPSLLSLTPPGRKGLFYAIARP